MQEAQQQFVDNAGFAGAAGAGDAEHRRLAAGEIPFLAHAREFGFVVFRFLDRGKRMADGNLVVDRHDCVRRLAVVRRDACRLCGARAAHDILDHGDQTQVHAVVGVIDAFDAVGFEFLDLLRRDRSAATGEDADVRGIALFEHVDHVFEVFNMAALIRTQRDRVGVFLQRGAHDIFDAAVVAQVHDLGTVCLDQPAHDVDRRVVAVEQAGGRDKAQRRSLDGRIVGDNGLGWRTHDRSSSLNTPAL